MKRKNVFFSVVVSVFFLSCLAHASETFMHPSKWGLMMNDSDPSKEHYHYNTFKEDRKHKCFKHWGIGVDDDDCTAEKGYTFNSDGYALRGCGYGQHCSHSEKFHSGIDYEVPTHKHDPKDYDGDKRKSVGLRQGKGIDDLGCHEKDDDIRASNDGVVISCKEIEADKFGKTVILRHICAPNTPNVEKLCVREGNDWVIYTQYSHMSKITVTKGKTVKRGQKIGEIGGTGGWIHHLHFEFKIQPVHYSPKNPRRYGYTDGDPTELGYRNPLLFLGKVRVADESTGAGNFCPACPSGANCFKDGNTYHIIHPDYRCSNNLCWKPGGDRNCYDADEWYEIRNGDINDFVRHRSREEMCAEVYSAGNQGGTGNSGGSPGFYPSGPNPQAIDDEVRADIRVDFDVFDESGIQVSANNGKPSKPLQAGQRVRTSLELMVANTDVKSSLRDPDRDHVSAKIWWRIKDKTGWKQWVKERYDVDDLGRGKHPGEEEWKEVPDRPGEILQLKACGDTSDRVKEPKEGGQESIKNPDQSGTHNNCSRTESFYINHPFGYLDGVNQKEIWGWARNPNSTKYVDVHIYVDGPPGQGTFLGGTTAIEPRNDLPYPDKNHGFRYKIPNTLRDNKSHSFYVYAINPDGENPPLKNSPRAQKIANQMPQGAIYGNGCRIDGWAKDPDTNGPATIHFYIDAPVEEGGEFIGSATTYNDQYQFISTVPAKYRREPHKIWGYVIDNYNMGHTVLMGSPYQTDCMKVLIPLLFN